jgi:hypothetical protein
MRKIDLFYYYVTIDVFCVWNISCFVMNFGYMGV